MKKLLLTLIGLVLAVGLMAQTGKTPRFHKQKKSGQETTVEIGQHGNRPESVIWSQNFSSMSGVSFYQTPTSSNGWKIVNAIEPNLANEPTHQFGTALNSTSGGPFAHINSDSFPNGTQNSSLILKVGVSLVGVTNVQLSFEHFFRRFQESHIAQVSSDSINWVEVYNSSLTVPVNTTIPNTTLEQINISTIAANQANLWIRFVYVGVWDWFWAVDDVTITELPPNDLRLVEYELIPEKRLAFYGTNLKHLLDDSISFSAKYDNFGTLTQTGIELTSSVSVGGNTIFNNVVSAGNLATTALDSSASSSGFTLNNSTVDGEYLAKIVVSSDSVDSSPTNNEITIPFTVSPTNSTRMSLARPSFTKSASLGTSSFQGSQDGFIAMSMIELSASDTITGIRIRLGTSVAGGLIQATIRDTAGLFGTPAGGVDFPIIIEADLYTLSAADIAAGFVVIPFEEILAGLPQNRVLAPGAYYAAAELFSQNNATHIRVLDDLTYEEFQTSYASMIFTTDDNQWYPNGVSFAIDGVFENVLSNSVNNLENSSFLFRDVYPNPAQNELNLPFTLKKDAQVKINIRDMSGRLVYDQAAQNQLEGVQLVTLPIEQLRSGVYFVELIANGQNSRQKFVVNR